MTELITALVALFFFGAALVYHDENRKLKRRIRSDKEDATAYCVSLKDAIRARDDMLAHWCNECIQLQRRLDKEYLERRRWEIEASAKLPTKYN